MKSNKFDSVYKIVWSDSEMLVLNESDEYDSESTTLLNRSLIWLYYMIPITDDRVTCIVWDDIDYETD